MKVYHHLSIFLTIKPKPKTNKNYTSTAYCIITMTIDHYFHYHPYHHDDEEEEPRTHDEEEEEPFHSYFWKNYRRWTYAALFLVILGLPTFLAGSKYTHVVQEPICGCEPDKDYCCPMNFNNANSGAATKNCPNHQCYCYERLPYTDMRTGDYFCMPLVESKSFDIKIVTEPCPMLLLVGFVCLACGILALTAICWSIPTEQRNHEAMEIQKEMALLQSRLRIASAALSRKHHHGNAPAIIADKPEEYQKLCQVEIV